MTSAEADRECRMTLQQMKYAVTIADKGSMNEAAKVLFISQPSLSGSIKDLENEIGVILFNRTNRGITTTTEGKEFLGYARQTLQQYRLMEDRYIDAKPLKKKFHVSTQHYTFAVKAFAEMIKQFGMDEYDFAIYETRTYEVIEDVKNFRSDIGILYLNDFNERVLQNQFRECDLTFHELFACHTYVYISATNPLASKKIITMEDLQEYPRVSFDQGEHNSFYYSEEVLSTYETRQLIHTNDRATVLNMMVAMNGYTLCSGILCEELNGEGYIAVPLDTDEIMHIGYITRDDIIMNKLGEIYIDELKKYRDNVL